MSNPPDRAPPDLFELVSLFPPSDCASWEVVSPEAMPLPYRRLLAHQHHMTVTVEACHGELVDVRVLEKTQSGDSYARKILLVTQKSKRVVQYGVMRIHLRYCSDAVRAAILAETTPLGRILIEHDVLRRIEPIRFLKVMPATTMMQWFSLHQPASTFGRLAYIHCDGQPAVELLEIVAPV